MKLQINSEVCQGHGRCYDLAPKLFGEDDEGYGTVLGDGTVPADQEDAARLAVANCPEQAISLTEAAAVRRGGSATRFRACFPHRSRARWAAPPTRRRLRTCRPIR